MDRLDRSRIFLLMNSTIFLLVVLCFAVNVCHSFPLSKRLLKEATATDSSNLHNDFNANLFHRHNKHRRKVVETKEALIYLRQYGYLNGKHLTTENMEQALRSFQQVAGVKVTGHVTQATLASMHKARCGNADIEMKLKSKSKRKKRFAQASKWMEKMDRGDILRLKWFIESYTMDMSKTDIQDTVRQAFRVWTEQAPMPSMRTVKLDFTETFSSDDSDISIKWATGKHGDDYPFDDGGNSSNVLAHTFYPNYQEAGSLNGNIHFDDFENWVLDSHTVIERGVYFPYVLAHEIGHALGLGHSRRQEAVMNPIYKQTPLNSLRLDIDDKCAINWNYIGPSNTCLFVWLMVEFLPRAKENNNNNTVNGINSNSRQPPPNQAPTGLPPDPYKTNRKVVGEMTLDKKVEKLFDSLQHVNIPQCSDDNSVQFQYEEMLIKKLDFSRHSAHYYSKIICNYAAGLSDVLEKKRDLDPTNDQRSTTYDVIDDSIGPLEMSVHSYPSSPFNAEQSFNFHHVMDTDEVLDPEDSNVGENGAELLTRLNRAYFNEDFFARLFKLFAKTR